MRSVVTALLAVHRRHPAAPAPRVPVDGSSLLGARLDLLVSFVVLAEVLSYTTAARMLFVSPSGLSRRITQLETVVSCRLLDRTTRRVRLNECGRALLPHAAAAVAQFEAGAALALEAGAGPMPTWGLLREG
jgi:DNA-binding transcriptional LysR family regulator